MASMLGKLACMRLRSGRHLKPGREKRIYKRAQRAREKRNLADLKPAPEKNKAPRSASTPFGGLAGTMGAAPSMLRHI